MSSTSAQSAARAAEEVQGCSARRRAARACAGGGPAGQPGHQGLPVGEGHAADKIRGGERREREREWCPAGCCLCS
jgi:hypothetical protein